LTTTDTTNHGITYWGVSGERGGGEGKVKGGRRGRGEEGGSTKGVGSGKKGVWTEVEGRCGRGEREVKGQEGGEEGGVRRRSNWEPKREGSG
jgi:hypothetical protein